METSSASNSNPDEVPQPAVPAAVHTETVDPCASRSEGDILRSQDPMRFRESAEESVDPFARRIAQQAASYFFHRQYIEVIALVTGVLDMFPTFSDIYIYRAMACAYSKDYPQSMRDLWKACQMQGHGKYAWGCLLTYLKRVMEYGVGEVSQNTHLTFVAASETYHLQALISFLAGEPDTACTHVGRALIYDWSNADARSLWSRVLDVQEALQHGRSHFNSGDFERAVGEYEKALDKIGYSEQEYRGGVCRVQVLLYRAKANLELVHLKECWDDVDEMMALNPTYSEAYTFRAVLNRAVGRRREAEADLAFATSLQTNAHTCQTASADTNRRLAPSDIWFQAPSRMNGTPRISA